jgi:hypothetical protein
MLYALIGFAAFCIGNYIGRKDGYDMCLSEHSFCSCCNELEDDEESN